MPRSGEETKTGDGRREKKRRKKRKKKKKKKKRARSETESESDAGERRQTRDAERLTRAILEGDYRRVRRRSKRCKRSETINTRVGLDGYTPLHVAVLCRAADICLQLLKCGANVDAVDAEGTTPLLHAVLLGDASVASLLVDRGADCSIRDKSGNGPYDFGLTDILRRHRANGVAKQAAREIRNFQRVRKMQEEYEWQQKLRMEDDAYQESMLVRQEYLRWHPDKFKQRYRGTFSGAPAEWDALLLRVASVAKSLSSMKLDALRL
eukprot:g1771.t1